MLLLPSSCLSIRPSVRPLGTNWLPMNGFSRNFILEYFLKICRENSSFIKTNINFWSNLPQFFLELEMSRTKFVVKIKIQILCSINFLFRKSCRLLDNVYNVLEPGRPQMTIWRISFTCLYLRLQTHTENMQYLLLFHCNNGCTNAPQCYVIRTVPVL